MTSASYGVSVNDLSGLAKWTDADHYRLNITLSSSPNLRDLSNISSILENILYTQAPTLNPLRTSPCHPHPPPSTTTDSEHKDQGKGQSGQDDHDQDTKAEDAETWA
jgi:hypothetical protein